MDAADTPRAIAVIPARYESIRFPGKALTDLAGKTMIERVVERTASAATIERVLVATDDARIADAVKAFGGEAVMTRADHRSGTERLAEVASHVATPVFVNVQGDEPLIDPAAIDLAVETIASAPDVSVATLATPILEPGVLMDANVVKVVMDFDSNALYFSRAPIPWMRDQAGTVSPRYFKHLGLYVYRRDTLLEFPTLPPGELERIEQLEQLRWLENGYQIRVAQTDYDSISIDVPEDVPRVLERLGRGRKKRD
jgi:3-deoxy-manno-octulosonate cytidylyltransferase (CMP-KDO synthetase)